MSRQEYVPIKAICEELTSYGFSYKFGGSSPIIQPWKLSEGKARKVGLLFEGEKAIRKFWEEQVRPKLPDEFYKRRNVDCIFWVDEARKILGFDGPDYKDRFATARRFNQIHATKIAAAANTVGAPGAPAAVAAGAAAVAAPAAATSGASTTAAHEVSSIPSGLETKAVESDRGAVPAAGMGGKKRKSSSSSSSSSSIIGGLGGDGSGEDPQKKKKKKRKKKRESEPDDGLIHYTDLLRKYPAKSAFSTSTNTADTLSERLPTTTHNHQPHPSASASLSLPSSSSTSKPKTIHNAPWIHAKEQAELFESLYARVSVLNDSLLRQASDLLRRGNPQMIGLMKAYVGKETDEANAKQFKRVLMTLLG